MIELNALSLIFTAVYLFQFVFSLWLERLNRDHMRSAGKQAPAPFREFIDEATLARINEYSADKSRFSDLRKTVTDLALLIVILTGTLSAVDSYSFNPQVHYIWAGLIFFVSVGILFFIFELPFDYYETFVIEEKYGFNKSNLKTWVADNLKSELLSIFFLICIMAPLLWTIELSPDYWWLWGFIIVAVIQFGVLLIYPVLIAPFIQQIRAT